MQSDPVSDPRYTADGGPPAERREFWRSTLRLAAAYWLFYFVINSVLWGMAGISPVATFVPKLFLIAFCALTTIAMSAVLYRVRHRPFGPRIFIAFAMSAMATPLFCLVDHVIHMIAVYPRPVPLDPIYLGYSTIEGLALFFGWSSLSVSLLYSAEVRDQARLTAVAREEAISAQMRALRYQVNPHFLFNTLNAIAGLIEEGATARAGRVVISLSNFLRSTLALDPVCDVSLSDELALQMEYLRIERERFDDRMELSIDIAAASERAMLPSLILQPLIENAMKHGIGTVTGRCRISIVAKVDSGRLLFSIENDVSADAPRSGTIGTGIGLKNVADRLAARFDGDVRLSFGPAHAGRYRAAIDIPLITL